MIYIRRIFRGVFSLVLFTGWAWAVGLIVSRGATNWPAFTAGTVFGLILMAAANYVLWRMGGFREDPSKEPGLLQLFGEDDDGDS